MNTRTHNATQEPRKNTSHKYVGAINERWGETKLKPPQTRTIIGSLRRYKGMGLGFFNGSF